MFLKGALKKYNYLHRVQGSMLSKGVRAFGSSDVQQFVAQDIDSLRKEANESHRQFHHQQYQNLQTYSKDLLAQKEAQEAAEAEWLASLRDVDQKKTIFGKISEIKGDDHHHLKYIKNKIAKLVRQELDYLQFQEQLSQEERESLTSDIYKEVKTKSNFYFSIDENKKEKNLKIYNKKAPGNAHRHPSVILPHENVHIQRYINSKDLTEEKLYEIYAYYSHLIDLHIS